MKTKEVTVYMDGVDWQHEIGEASDGNKVFPSVEALRENNRCWKGCGVVKCKVTLEEWVVEQNFNEMFGDSSKTYSVEELKTNATALRIEATKKRIEHLEKLMKSDRKLIEILEKKLEENK